MMILHSSSGKSNNLRKKSYFSFKNLKTSLCAPSFLPRKPKLPLRGNRKFLFKKKTHKKDNGNQRLVTLNSIMRKCKILMSL